MKAYVAHITPKISPGDFVARQVSIDETGLKNIEEDIKKKPLKQMVPTQKADPLSRIGGKR